MSKVHQIKSYLKYLWKGKSQYYIHSPFVHELVQKVFLDGRYFYAYDDAAFIRNEMRKSKQVLNVKDLGAGSLKTISTERKVSEIAQSAAIQPKYGKLLFRLINHFKPTQLLELGTSLGISTLYQAKGNRNGKLVSIEGSEEIAQVAQQNFQRIGINNVQQIVGAFDEVLPKVLQELGRLDWVFIDGNHRKNPTLQYFEWCLKYAHEDTIFVFDDIHWTPEMEEAWEAIKQHPQVSLSLDVFQLGIVFLKKRPMKEHFMLYY